MRVLATVFLWLVLIVAVLGTVLFAFVIAFGEDAETRLGGVIFVVAGLAVTFGARALIKRLRRALPSGPPVAPAQIRDGVEVEIAPADSAGITPEFRKNLGL